MSDNEHLARSVPPYIPLLTLINFIGKLNKTVLPPRIDYSLTQNLSGGMSGALQSALRFLGLIDKAGTVLQPLNRLVESYGTDQWKACLGEIISPAYIDIIDGLDINSATSGQLEGKFRDNGKVEGQMVEKAVRFYLAVLDEAGIAKSPHFKTRRARAANGRKSGRRVSANRQRSNDEETRLLSGHNAGTERFQIPIPRKPPATISVPRDLTTDDWEMLKEILATYIKRLIASNEDHEGNAPAA